MNLLKVPKKTPRHIYTTLYDHYEPRYDHYEPYSNLSFILLTVIRGPNSCKYLFYSISLPTSANLEI